MGHRDRMHRAGLALLAICATAVLGLVAAAAASAAINSHYILEGTGSGRVFGEEEWPGEPPIDCTWNGETQEVEAGSVCDTQAEFLPEYGFSAVRVAAEAAPGSEFAEWIPEAGSGFPCPKEERGAGACVMVLLGKQTEIRVRARFVPLIPLGLSTSGSGSGSLECRFASPGVLPVPCNAEYGEGAEIEVVPSADYGSEFVEWTGDCSGSDPKGCTVTMDEEHSVGAVFTLMVPITTKATGTGSGQVDCEVNGGERTDEPCEASYLEGTELELTAVPDKGSAFAGFENGAGNASGCVDSPCGPFTLDEASAVEAKFDSLFHTLTVEASGEGSVSADSGTISGCEEGAGVCSGSYVEGSVVTLAATPGKHKVVHWTGCDAVPANDECELEMPAGDTTVDAEFVTPPEGTLTVEATGAGSVDAEEPPAPASGSVSGCEEGSGSCSAVYYQGETVALVATPGAHRRVAWSGCDAEPVAGECEVEIDEAAVTVGAVFALEELPLAVTVDGSGTGTVKSAPAGIECEPVCEAEYDYGTVVTLTGLPATGSRAAVWSGCDELVGGDCRVTMAAAKSVTATFDANPTPTPTPSPTPTPTPAPAPEQCVVPRLAGKKLGQAKSALAAAHCTLGKVRKPNAKRGKRGGKHGPLVVKSSSPGAGSTLAAGAKVDLKLVQKGKKKHKRTHRRHTRRTS